MKQNTGHPIIRSLGNLLVILSIFGISSLVYPYLKAELIYRLYPSDLPVFSTDDFSLTIPDIKLSALIIPNVNPWNKAEYSQALQTGVAHAAGSSFPGKPGTIFLFAHSSGNPWLQAYTNTQFYRLNRLNTNNIIILKYQGRTYQYKVTRKQIVDPFRTDIISQSTANQLILQTCWPIGTDWQRLIVIAVPE